MLNLEARHLRTVKSIIADKAPGTEVWAFGSRVSGKGHEGSDLDLVLRNPGGLDKPLGLAANLKAAFSDSNLPFSIDVLDWAEIPPSFRAEIEGGGREVMQIPK